ncbi:MAG: hypothetical protein AB8E15_06205 [Bdellovibrionales bacterium]
MQAKKKTEPSRRENIRKHIGHIGLSSLSVFAKYPNFAQRAELVDLSVNGMLIHVTRDNLSKTLKNNFNLDDLEGRFITLNIDPMELEMDALIVRTKRIDKNTFELALDYSEGVPEYWRECLFDLIPGEFHHHLDGDEFL